MVWVLFQYTVLKIEFVGRNEIHHNMIPNVWSPLLHHDRLYHTAVIMAYDRTHVCHLFLSVWDSDEESVGAQTLNTSMGAIKSVVETCRNP